jgi:acetoacetyl-CoA synthetase
VSTAAPEKLWEPPAELVERSRLREYMRWLASERGLDFAGYDELWRWSVDDLEGFWSSIWEFFEVQADGGFERALGSREMPGAEWFTGTSLNYAEHVFAGKDDAETAILHASELRELDELSWGALRGQVAATAAGLRALGVERGDRVVAYMPNIPETIVAFLATASIGAIWSSCSPDFGPASVIDRFAQIEPKVLFAVDGYRCATPCAGTTCSPPARGRSSASSAFPSTIRSGSSTRPARPACPSRSSSRRVASCSSTSRSSTSTSTPTQGTGSSGSRRPAG